MWRTILPLVLVLAACAPRGQMTVVAAARGIGAQQTVFVGTNRSAEPEPARFGRGREEREAYRRYVLSIPPDRKPGELTWPPRGGTPDARRHFLTLEETAFADAAAFRTALAGQMVKTRRGQRDVVVFVHGFNTNFAEGVYRVAQLAHDLQFPGTTVHFSWPSAGDALGYVYDRDSALSARDRLEALLDQIAAAGAERILIFGHSMGAALTMETIRQARLAGSPFMRRLQGIVLMSPDIDVEVFRGQAMRIGQLPQPILVFSSERDRALSLSSLVAREPNRLGNLTDLRRVADLDVVLLDVTAFSTGLGHLTPGTSPQLIALLNRSQEIDAAFNADAESRIGILPGTVLTLQGATRIIVSPVVGLAGALRQ
ncbi:MAG: alpha/beta hydrolase [Gemmobacter sp.]